MAIKPNIAEILENCPKGMELYSPIFGKVYLAGVRPHLAVIVNIGDEHSEDQEEFLYDGRYGLNGECMLFPSKGKDSWEGFVPPVAFKDGDIVATDDYEMIGIAKGGTNGEFIVTYCVFDGEDDNLRVYSNYKEVWKFDRLATDEEKEKLFKALNDHNYVWDAENNKLEKRTEPKFKVGDTICEIGDEAGYFVISGIDDLHYYCDVRLLGMRVLCDISDQDKWRLVPKEEMPEEFKDGDIVSTGTGNWIGVVTGGHSGGWSPTYCVLSDRIGFRAYLKQKEKWSFSRLATDEEKERLFKAIKDNGYVWNAEDKRLEKLEAHIRHRHVEAVR